MPPRSQRLRPRARFCGFAFALCGLCAAGLGSGACTPQGDPKLAPGGFTDRFERSDLGSAWNNTGGPFRIVNGELHVRGAHNRPLWLKRRLPHDVHIEFDVRSESTDGDIKVEVFGDGVSKATTASYTATSYVVIFGGWKNQLNVLARMDEHAHDRVVGPSYKVVPGKTYHMKIERQGDIIQAWVDDKLLLKLEDPKPLSGPSHDHFAFNNWESDVYFDNLKVEAL